MEGHFRLHEGTMISRDSLKGITSVIAVGLAIFQIYFTAGFGIIDSQLLRTIHLGIVLALVFLYFPPKKLQEGEREHPGWLALDLVLICGAFATAYFLASDTKRMRMCQKHMKTFIML